MITSIAVLYLYRTQKNMEFLDFADIRCDEHIYRNLCADT